jgi:hypothetical protein
MAKPEKVKAKEAPSRKLDCVRVLLIEDERIIREIVVRLLKAIGIREVTEAARRAEAVLNGEVEPAEKAELTADTLFKKAGE